MVAKVEQKKEPALDDLLSMFEDELNVESEDVFLATDVNREIGLLNQQGMIIYN